MGSPDTKSPNRFRNTGLVWHSVAFAVVALLAAPWAAHAQGIAPRVAGIVDESNLVTLRGNTHPLARAQNDQGPGANSPLLHRRLLLLKRSDPQKTALRAMLDGQHSQSSPNFHQWLTPQQFG